MLCCQFPAPLIEEKHEAAFTVDASRITFGRGCITELGWRAERLGMRRVALFTDARIAKLEHFARAKGALEAAGLSVAAYTEVRVEPTDHSFEEAIRFARDAAADGYVSIGGGSVIDTCKAANLFATYPAPLERYVNAPVGEGRAIPGPLRPHIACPTTSGTGSEVTGIAIFDHTGKHAKTGIAAQGLRPTEALVDPDATRSLPASVVAASGLDVLCHALESFTAKPYTRRVKAVPVAARPMSQGANPWSDIGCREALRLLGRYLFRAHDDASDEEAREAVMWAATLAGIAFGNAGVHVPHAMAYGIAGLAHEAGHRPPSDGYPAAEPLVPHGISVMLGAPAVFQRFASTHPARHLECAQLLGANVHGASLEDAGVLLREWLVVAMRRLNLPDGVAGVGYREEHLAALVEGTALQTRLLSNAPLEATNELLREVFLAAWSYA